MTANQLAYLQYEEQRRRNAEDERLRQADLDFARDRYDNEAYLRDLTALKTMANTGESVAKMVDHLNPTNEIANLIDAVVPF